MTLGASDSSNSSCSLFSKGRNVCESFSTGSSAYEEGAGEDAYLEYPEEKRDPTVVPVYNGRVLDINSDLVCSALSGISVKHYNGSCLRPRRESPVGVDEYLVEEDNLFEYGDIGTPEAALATAAEEDDGNADLSRTMSSMVRVCYDPKWRSRGVEPELVAEEAAVDFRERPPCVRDGINSRNSFWDVHRPELSKLTWPHDYVAEAVVIEHLHRHLLSHGPVCSAFHEQQDMVMLLNKELDHYGRLREIQPPRDLPPDEKPFDFSGNRKTRSAKANPCRPFQTSAAEAKKWNDDSDLDPFQSVHPSKEEFCITIGRPVKKPVLKDLSVVETEAGALWLPAEDTEYDQYEYSTRYQDDSDSCESFSGEAEMEESFAEEVASEVEMTPQPTGWVEPDYCAMI